MHLEKTYPYSPFIIIPPPCQQKCWHSSKNLTESAVLANMCMNTPFNIIFPPLDQGMAQAFFSIQVPNAWQKIDSTRIFWHKYPSVTKNIMEIMDAYILHVNILCREIGPPPLPKLHIALKYSKTICLGLKRMGGIEI